MTIIFERILILHETLHFYKFEDADFKYDNTFSNLQPKIPKQGNFGSKFDFFFVLHNFLQILGCWFLMTQSFLPIFSLKILKRAFLISNLRVFILHETFLNLHPKITQIRDSYFQNWSFLCCTTCLFTSLRVLIPNITFSKDFGLKISRKEHFLSQI